MPGHFERRIKGEQNWYPVSAEDVREALRNFYPSIGQSIRDMQRFGEVIYTAAAEYRWKRDEA